MNAADSVSPRAQLQAKRKRAVRILGMILSGLMVLTMLVIFALIVRTERAHDEERCKFASFSQRKLGSTEVLEERRACLPELEERRYLVRRGQEPAFELARKRFPSGYFSADRYKWTLREDAAHRLVVRIDVDGKLSSEFFEEDARP